MCRVFIYSRVCLYSCVVLRRTCVIPDGYPPPTHDTCTMQSPETIHDHTHYTHRDSSSTSSLYHSFPAVCARTDHSVHVTHMRHDTSHKTGRPQETQKAARPMTHEHDSRTGFQLSLYVPLSWCRCAPWASAWTRRRRRPLAWPAEPPPRRGPAAARAS